jgi:hypothetical protein
MRLNCVVGIGAAPAIGVEPGFRNFENYRQRVLVLCAEPMCLNCLIGIGLAPAIGVEPALATFRVASPGGFEPPLPP